MACSDGVDGEDAEGDRDAELQGHLGQALGALASHVFEVRGAATDHRAEGDDGVEAALLGDLLGHQRDLEGTRGADDGDLAFSHAVADQGVDGAADQAFHDEAVEAADHQGVAAFGAMKVPSMVFRVMSRSHLLKSRDAVAPRAKRVERSVQHSAHRDLARGGRDRPYSAGRYSTTSRSKPDIALKRIGALSRRILRTPRSRRICEPAPTVL